MLAVRIDAVRDGILLQTGVISGHLWPIRQHETTMLAIRNSSVRVGSFVQPCGVTSLIHLAPQDDAGVSGDEILS
jgi:hypothetical protein